MMQNVESNVMPKRFVVFVGLVVAVVMSMLLGGAAHAEITRIGPNTNPAGGYANSNPRYVLEATPENVISSINIPIYSQTCPAGNTTINAINFKYPVDNGTAVSRPPVRFNGAPAAGVTGTYSFNVPASAFSYDPSSGWCQAVVTASLANASVDPGPTAWRKTAMFRLRAPAGMLVGIGGGQRYSTLSDYYYRTTSTPVYTYRVPFATPCNLFSNATSTIILNDLDSGNADNLGHTVTVRVYDETTSSYIATTQTGSLGQGGERRVRMTFQPGHLYRLVITGMHANNSVDYVFPYDNISYQTRCAWNTQPGIRAHPSNPATPTVGGVIRWQHRARVTPGSAPLDRAVAGGWTATTGTGTGLFTLPVGRTSVNGWSNWYNSSYTVQASDAGSSICRRTYVRPYRDTNTATLVSDPVCITIPYSYTLEPFIYNLNPDDVADSGQSINVTGRARNNGPSNSRTGTVWELTSFVVDQGVATPRAGGGTSAAAPCAFLGATATNCNMLESGSGEIVANNFEELVRTVTMPTLEAGAQLCFVMSVRPYTQTGDTWRHSVPGCVVAGKKPKVQVWGGDVRSGGIISTGVTTRGSGATAQLFGSWGEYGALSTDLNSGFASAAGLNDGGDSALDTDISRHQLTFANTPSSLRGSFGMVTHANLTGQFETLASTGPSLNGTVDLAGLNGVYDAGGNITIHGDVSGNRSVIIRASGTVTIDGNIRYVGQPYTSIDEIPQVVIIAENINIRNEATWVDAWLLARAAVNTCSNVAVNADLSTTICDDALTVNGPVSTNQLHLRRTSGSGETVPEADDPAEVFNLRADAALWLQTRNTGTNRAITVYTRELPPRF